MAKKKQKKKFIRRNIPQIKVVVGSGDVNYKNVNFLLKFLSPRFKILPRQRTGVSAKVQRRVTLEIKKARIMGLLPFTEKQQI